MSIVAMQSLTLVGLKEEKQRVLDALQAMGCLHLVALNDSILSEKNAEVSDETGAALKLLESWHIKQTTPNTALGLSPQQIQEQALEIQGEMEKLSDELELLEVRIRAVEPWGDFAFDSLESMGGLALWFYLVPNHQVSQLDELEAVWQVVGKDSRHSYLVVIAAEEPRHIPWPRQHLGTRSLSALRAREEEIKEGLSALQIRGAELARDLPVLRKRVHELYDLGELKRAAKMSFDDSKFFGIQAWLPSNEAEKLEAFAREKQLVYQLREAEETELPPTLFENPPAWEVGESLVGFYLTPSYRLWDPSFIVLYSFTVFFAMIMSDAGYGVVMAVILGMFWKKLGAGNGRFLCILLTLSTLVWGIMVGSYFGLEPEEGSFLSRFHILDMQNMDAMMMISIIVGASHIMLSNAIDAWRLRGQALALAPVGWIITILSSLIAFIGRENPTIEQASLWGIGLGLLTVFAFSGAQRGNGALKRLGGGAMAMTKITEAFGNVLSYLRLFALGIASAALAGAFNDLAKQASAGMPGLGVVLAILILLVGHALNFILAIMSGFIHGLRLNLIEFFNWSIRDEGYPFRAFKKKSQPNKA